MSPFLFIIAVDVLTRSLRLATSRGLIQSVGAFPAGCQPSCLQYADDTIILAPADVTSINNINTILSCFELLSGMSINSSKSSVFGLGNCDEDNTRRVADIVGCQVGHFPFLYLGIPLRHRALARTDWEPLLGRIQNRLAGWKGHCLSRGGRLVLVNAVLTSLPLHYMSFFRLPTWVIRRIDLIRRSFLWKGVSNAHGSASLIPWKTVCSPRSLGGWGVLNLSLFNKALLAKWCWMVIQEPKPPWSALVCFNYYGTRRIWDLTPPVSSSLSPFWRGVQHVAKEFLEYIAFNFRDGLQIKFWMDRWCGDTTLAVLFPTLF